MERNKTFELIIDDVVNQQYAVMDNFFTTAEVDVLKKLLDLLKPIVKNRP